MTDYNKKWQSHSCGLCFKPRAIIWDHPDKPRICPRCDVAEAWHNGVHVILGPPILEKFMRGEAA